MYASLAMHSKAYQQIFKDTSILGMCIGERKEELSNGRKLWRQAMHGCTCTRYLSLFFSPSFYFPSSICTFYRDDKVASLLLLILFPILFFLRSSQFLYHRSHFTLIIPFSLLSYLSSSQRSSAYALSLSINLLYKTLMHLKNIRVNSSYL